jgi:5-methylcytosine-specific restriction enzyme subunit McrC
MVQDGTTVRICEWSAVTGLGLSSEQRCNISEAAIDWQKANNLPEAPLWFSGPEGETLNTRQYVGVVELCDTVIEIYPKLDKHLLEEEKVKDKNIAGSVMLDLLWILDVSGYLGITEIDKSNLMESPTSFYDVFALLMAKHLRAELNMGVPHTYITVNDDIRMVRGKIRLSDQITRNLNRLDLISCEWDEFTPNTPMNQLLKCSCSFLMPRVRDGGASKALMDCITQFDEVSDVDPLTALTGVLGHRWDRRNERFQPVFDLAKRLLQGVGHILSSADTSTFVFLLDMNKVFEEYVKALLEAYFNVDIEYQKRVGWLFPCVSKGKIKQQADYLWCTKDGTLWVGDAKYKHLAKNQIDSLMFTQILEEDNDSSTPAGKILSPNDIRQLTVYAELIRKKNGVGGAPNILLLYPFVGDGDFKSDTTRAWNDSEFALCPVSMHKRDRLECALPANIAPLDKGATDDDHK